MTGVHKLFIAGLAALSLALASPAMAQDSSIEGYGGGGGRTQEKIDRGQADDQGGSLPFTGLDLGLMAGGAMLLALLGFGLRRATSSAGRAT